MTEKTECSVNMIDENQGREVRCGSKKESGSRYAEVGIGGFYLLSGRVLSWTISAIGSFIVIRLLGPKEYGLVTIAWIVPNFVISMKGWGFDAALTRYVSRYRSSERWETVSAFIFSGFLVSLLFGLIMTITIVMSSTLIASHILQKEKVEYLLLVASLYVTLSFLFSTTRAVALGLQKMRALTAQSVVQGLLYTIIVLMLLVGGLKSVGVILARIVATGLAVSLGIFLIIIEIPERIKKMLEWKKSKETILTCTVNLIRYSIPVNLGYYLQMVLEYGLFILASRHASEIEFGWYGLATKFTIMGNLLIFPIENTILPLFSERRYDEDPQRFQRLLERTIKYSTLILMPLVILTFLIGKDVVTVAFGSQYLPSSTMASLIILALTWRGIDTAISWLAFSQNQAQFYAQKNLISLVIGIALGLLVIPRIGIWGLVLTELIIGLMGTITIYILTKRRFHFEIKVPVRVYLNCLFSLIVTFLVLTLQEEALLRIIIGPIVCLVSYVILLPIVGSITNKDIPFLRGIFEKVPIVSKGTNILFDYFERVIGEK